MKVCYDCVHYLPLSMIIGIRACSGSKTIDPVSGVSKHYPAEKMRLNGGECGPNAVLFEPGLDEE